MLRGRRSQSEEGRVQVEGGDQSQQAGVGDHAEAGQGLNLLPAVELLPERRRHLGQGLSEEGDGGGGVYQRKPLGTPVIHYPESHQELSGITFIC